MPRNQPDACVATRDEDHDDDRHSSIVATTGPARTRAWQRMDTELFGIEGVDPAPLERTIANGRRLVRYRAEIATRTARATRASIERARG